MEEVYQLSFDGLRDAVKKSKDAAELKDLLDVPSINTAQTMWASVNNTIMDIALEKNHKNIIWDIKREVATALTVGDRYDTMADRLAESLNGNYKKANLIARTEIGRVREAGHLAAAKDINETISQGSSGLRMVKKWMSMKDAKVRDQHQEMHGKIVEMDEPFELPDGVETQAPKQSGVARHDCNCRCTCLYPLMDDAMFFKATGKHFKNMLPESKNGDNINADNRHENLAEGLAKKDSKVEFSADDTARPYEIKLSREEKKAIISRGVTEKQPIFAKDTKDNKFASNVAKVPKIDGFYDVALHGRDTSVDFFGTPIDAYTLSQVIRQREDYSPGTKIRLLSCNVGNTNNTGDCVAQLIANELGVIVTAPTDILYVDGDGKVTIGKRNTGTMKKFYPRK